MGKLILCVGALLALSVSRVGAVPVTVQELSVSPAQVAYINVTGFYSGGAYAGIVNLKVNGVETDGFCIDPFHFSSRSSMQYEMVNLADAPKAYLPTFNGDMGELKAAQISKLWGMAFSATMTASQAAAMQIAIWEIVAGDLFSVSGNDFGASVLLGKLATYSGPAANLVGLTGPGQDYVIASVPDGGATALLFLIGFGAMSAAKTFVRRK
ncbi:MAG TPA: hypothetical protein VF773_06375 [Verrucomicrobiae bacterium]